MYVYVYKYIYIYIYIYIYTYILTFARDATVAGPRGGTGGRQREGFTPNPSPRFAGLTLNPM